MLYGRIQYSLGQLIVVPFFFFSGYGISLSIAKKGRAYVRTFVTHKIPKLFVHFDIVVLVFLLVNIAFGVHYPVIDILLSFLSIYVIGNSNWFITVTILLYLFVYLCYSFSDDEKVSLGAFVICTVVVAYVSARCNVPTRYYNSVIAFPFGLALGTYERALFSAGNKSAARMRKVILCAVSILCFVVSHRICRADVRLEAYILFYWLMDLSFCVLIYLFCTQFRFRSRAFHFLGTYLFEIYMLQRIPMNIIRSSVGPNPPVIPSFVVVLVTTIAMAVAFRSLFRQLDSRYDSLLDSRSAAS